MREAWAGLLLAIAAVSALAGSPAEAVTASYADCLRLPAEAQQHAAYLWLGDAPEKSRVVLTQLINYQLNAVSTEPDLIAAVPVGPDLLRIDRRDPGPAFAVAWEKTADVDPIFHLAVEIAGVDYEEVPRETREDKNVKGYFWARNDAGTDWVPATSVPKTIRRKKAGASSKRAVLATQTIEGCPTCRGWLPTKEALALAELTHSNSPVLGAQWWWARAVREVPLNNRADGTGYSDWLGFKDRDAVFKTIRFKEEDSVAIGKLLRAALEAGDSAVAQNGRQIERLQGPAGPVWVTLDVDHTDGDQNAVHNLKRGDFKPVAEEFYFALPNGLPGTFLAKFDDGSRQATAPDFIGSNLSPAYGGTDGRIHNDLSCSSCHGKQVLRSINDYVRRTYTGAVKLQSPDYQTEKDFQRQFFTNLERQRERDAAAFAEAMEAAGGMKVEKLVAAIDAEWMGYANVPLNAEAVGRLHGVDGKTLTAAVQAYYQANPPVGVEPALAPLLKPDGTISRSTAEEFYYVTEGYLWKAAP